MPPTVSRDRACLCGNTCHRDTLPAGRYCRLQGQRIPVDVAATVEMLDWMNRNNERVTVTPEGADELTRMGILPPERQVAPLVDGATLICPYLTKPLLLPDYEVAHCAECGDPIQYRPHRPVAVRHVCSVCGLRRMRGDA
jgi:hypothetical protein